MNQSDLTSLASLLTNARSADNDLRNIAESQIHTHLTHNPVPFVLGLASLMSIANEPDMRAFCAIVLRKKLTIGEPTLFDSLTDDCQQTLKSSMLQSLAVEPNNFVRRQIGDAVSELGSLLLYKDEWSELIPFIVQMLAASDAAIRVLGLWMIGKLSDAIDSIQQYLPLLSPLIASSLQDSDVNVQVESIKTLCKLISILEDQKSINDHGKAFPIILSLIEKLVISQNDEAVLSILTAIVELIKENNGELSKTLFKTCLDEYGVLMMLIITAGTPIFTSLPTMIHAKMFQSFHELIAAQTSQSAAISNDVRHMSMELLLSFGEDQPRLVRRSRTFITACVVSSFTFMLSVDSVSLTEWSQQDEEDDEDSFEVGEMGTFRLADAIKGDKLAPIIAPFFTQLITVNAWQYQHAALRTISAIGVVLPFEKLPISVIVNHLTHPHPRVRYGAVHCISQWACEFRPHMQESNHSILFPALIPSLIDSNYPRLQSHTAMALMHLCDELDESIMTIYAAQLLECLLTLLTSSSTSMVQEQVMSTIAAIATSAPTIFQSHNYYERVMALMKHVITEAKGSHHAMLRAKAMESITVVGMNVPKELFHVDAIQLMKIFLDWMNSEENKLLTNNNKTRMGLADDDVSEQYMMQAWSRICTVLGEEFTPMLEHLLPRIFAAANQTINMTAFVDSDDVNVLNELENISTSQTEEKIQSLRVLNSFTHDLVSGIFPYLRECASITVPLLSYSLNDEVRMYSISLMPLIVNSAVQAYQKQICDLNFLSLLLTEILHSMLIACKAEREITLLESLVKSLQECITHVRDIGIAQSVIDSEGLNVLADAMISLLHASQKRITAKEKEMEAEEEDEEGMDEESMLDMELAIEAEDSLHLTIADCIGTLIQSHQNKFVPTFIKLLPILEIMLNSSSQREKRVAVFLFDDLIENCDITGEVAQQLFSIFIPIIIKHVGLFSDERNTIKNEAPLRQACAYGVGLCAANCPAYFSPWAESAINRMIPVIEERIANKTNEINETKTNHNNDSINGEEEEVVHDTSNQFNDVDNVISALGKIAFMTPNSSQPSYRPYEKYFELFIRALPITDDKEEARSVHRSLLTLIDSNHPIINSLSSHILFIFSCLINSDCVDEETNSRIKHYLTTWKQTINNWETSITKQQLSQEQQQKVFQTLTRI